MADCSDGDGSLTVRILRFDRPPGERRYPSTVSAQELSKEHGDGTLAPTRDAYVCALPASQRDALKKLAGCMGPFELPLSRKNLLAWLIGASDDPLENVAVEVATFLSRVDLSWMDGLLTAIRSAGDTSRPLSAMVEYASPTTLRPAVVYEQSVKKALEEAWERPYRDPLQVLDYVAETIDGLFEQWNRDLDQLAAWTMVLQSSGWGKSRTIRELATKGFHVVYVSFLESGSTGSIPRRSPVADQLINSERSDDPRAVAAWILAILTEIKEKTPQEWMTEQSESRFVEHVAASYLVLCEDVLKAVPEFIPSPGENWHGVKLSSWFGSNAKKIVSPAIKIIVCMDEAASWFGQVAGSFLACRRFFSCIPRDLKVFGLVADTAGKLGLVFPDQRMYDPSSRARAPPTKFFEPIWVVGSLWRDLEKVKELMSEQLSQQDPTFPTAKLTRELFRWGRPLWRATLDNRADGREAVMFAIQKLLGGTTLSGLKPDGEEPVTDAMGIAVLGVAAGLEVVAWSELAKDMVASHMRTVSHVSGDCERLFTTDALEPILGEAAARILSSEAHLSAVLEVAQRIFKQAYVVEGPRGEIVGRIVLLLAIHACCKHKTSYNMFSHPVELQDFLTMLCGKQLKVEGLVCFNRFILINRKQITKADLLFCFLAGVAIIPKRGQKDYDVLLPTLMPGPDGTYELSSDRMQAVPVQIRNRDTYTVKTDNLAKAAFEWVVPCDKVPEAGASQVDEATSNQVPSQELEASASQLPVAQHPQQQNDEDGAGDDEDGDDNDENKDEDGDDDKDSDDGDDEIKDLSYVLLQEPPHEEPLMKKQRVVTDGETLGNPIAIYMHLQGLQRSPVEISEDGRVLILHQLAYAFLGEKILNSLMDLCSASFKLDDHLEGKRGEIVRYNLFNYFKLPELKKSNGKERGTTS